MKKCLKMVPNSSEFLFYSHDCMLNILNNFCIITIGVEFHVWNYLASNIIINTSLADFKNKSKIFIMSNKFNLAFS